MSEIQKPEEEGSESLSFPHFYYHCFLYAMMLLTMVMMVMITMEKQKNSRFFFNVRAKHNYKTAILSIHVPESILNK